MLPTANPEEPIFAPGYGEFSTGSGLDVEALAVAVPTDHVPRGVPDDLRTVLRGAYLTDEAAEAGAWSQAATAADKMNEAWTRYSGAAPLLLRPLVGDALSALTSAIAAHDATAARQASLDVLKYGLDVLLQHAGRVVVDFLRLDLWANQLELDASVRDVGGMKSDVVILGIIRSRLEGVGTSADRADADRIGRVLGALRQAVWGGDSAGAASGAARVRETLRGRLLVFQPS